MNLWFRLTWLLLTTIWRRSLDPRNDVSRLTFHVLPHDLDLNLHMNNGRYLTIMDLGRIDFVLRTGLWRPLWQNNWSPIISAAAIRFRRELRPFQRYHLVTRNVAWTGTTAVMEQTFIDSDGKVAARALIKAGFYARSDRAYVTVKRLIEALGVSPEQAESPPPSPEVLAFLKADAALRKPGEASG